jgi:AcrR family transcriptional regulator
MDAATAFYVDPADAPGKRAIMAAALDLFSTQGVDGVSIRDIAHRAGLTNPALFRHFAGKEALALALFAACWRQVAQVTALPDGLEFADRRRETLRRYLGAIDAAPAAVLFVQDNLRRFWGQLPADPARVSLLAAMRRLVSQGQAAGQVAPGLDPLLAAGAIIGILAQVARMIDAGEFPGGAEALLDPIDAMVERILAG